MGISSDTAVYPGDPQPLLEPVSSIEGDGYAVSRVSFGTHTGTHVDAPSHILEDGLSIDKIPLESLVGKAVVVDLTFVEADISSEELTSAFEHFEGSEVNGAQILLIKTRAPNGNADKGSLPVQNCLQPDAGSWIIEHGFRTVGVDTLSVDASEDLVNHRLFLENGIIIVENLDLAVVDPGMYYFICLPLKLEGCDAAPARVVLADKAFFDK